MRTHTGWLVLALGLPAQSADANELTVLVLDLATEGVSEAMGRIASAHLVGAVARQKGLRVVAQKELREQLDHEKTKAILGCEQDEICIADLMSRDQIDRVVSGTIGKVGKSLILNLSLIDRANANVLSRSGRPFATIEDMPSTVDKLVVELFGGKVGRSAEFQLPEGRESSFVVLDLQGAGVSAEIARNLTQVLTNEIKRVEGVRVINRDDVVALVGAEKMQRIFDEDCDNKCLMEIGGALDTNYLIIGQIGKLKDTFLISLTLLDQRSIEPGDSIRVTESFRGSEDELLRAVRHAGRRLLGIENQKLLGAIAVSGPVADAEVIIDSKSIGLLPLPPKNEFKSGRHSVRTAKDGYFSWESDVYVNPGETTAIWAELVEQPAPWFSKWWVWTLVGGAVVGGTTAAVLATQSTPGTGTGVVTIQ